MNKYQEALNGVQILPYKVIMTKVEDEILMERYYFELQELVDKATPKKPIKLEIIDLDEIIMPEYTNTIDKYMCDNCGLTWFIVDGHTYQHKYCKQCGQALDWSKDE